MSDQNLVRSYQDRLRLLLAHVFNLTVDSDLARVKTFAHGELPLVAAR